MDYNEDISISSLNRMLNSRIEKLIASTPMEESNRRQILYQIQDLPTFSRRLSGFLDYMIDHSSYLHQETWNLQSQIYAEKDKIAVSKMNRQRQRQKVSTGSATRKIEERINRLASRLGVKPNKIDDELNKLLEIENRRNDKTNEDEYKRCLRLVSADNGELSFVVNDLIQKVKRTRSIHNSTRSLFSPYSYTTPRTTRNSVDNAQTESPPQLQSISDL